MMIEKKNTNWKKARKVIFFLGKDIWKHGNVILNTVIMFKFDK